MRHGLGVGPTTVIYSAWGTPTLAYYRSPASEIIAFTSIVGSSLPASSNDLCDASLLLISRCTAPKSKYASSVGRAPIESISAGSDSGRSPYVFANTA